MHWECVAFLCFICGKELIQAKVIQLVSHLETYRPKYCRLWLKCDGTRTETRFRLSTKRTSPFKSAVGVSSIDYWQASCAHQPAGFVLLVQACVLQSCDGTGYPLHTLVSPSLFLPCVTVYHHISTGLYIFLITPTRALCYAHLMLLDLIVWVGIQTWLWPVTTCVCKPEAANTVRAPDDERYAARNMLNLQWTVE